MVCWARTMTPASGSTTAFVLQIGLGVQQVTAPSTGTTSRTPAVVPGTPSVPPLPPDELIVLAQKIFNEEDGGLADPSRLADDFRFEFPIVSLSKAVRPPRPPGMALWSRRFVRASHDRGGKSGL